MKFTAIAVMAAATALSLGMAGPALASPLSARSKPALQVSGTRLQSALLPASAFGAGFTVIDHKNTGSKLRSTNVVIKPSSLSCQTFATFIFIGGFGNTAGAVDGVNNPNPNFADPSTVYFDDQAVLQFKTTQAAASFYNQAYTKFKQCSAFTETEDGLQLELTTSSLSSTTVNKNKAFQPHPVRRHRRAVHRQPVPEHRVRARRHERHTVDNVSGTHDPISASLLNSLIKRVQALYRHH